MTPRRPALAVLALALFAASGTFASAVPSNADIVKAACSLTHDELLRTWQGYSPDRSPELQIVPAEPNFVGSGLPHVGPWDYVQGVPMLWYGPGYIKPIGKVQKPVTLADVAPTVASLLHFDFAAPDGSPMTDGLVPAADRPGSPKLIVTMVWDAGGRNVLEAHPRSWPYLQSLIPQGAWYENAFVGSSPTSTAQVHATIGTGALPRTHGLVGHRMRIGNTLTTPWVHGPAFIDIPTLADLYDRAMGNAPIVGTVATVNIHSGMMSHGAFFNGGDKDIMLTRSVTGGETITDEGFKWNLPGILQPFYSIPPYVNDVPGFGKDVEAVDAADGKIDGKWRNNDINQLLGGFDTPARVPYQTRVAEEIIKREGFGADETPDLLYINYKEIDYISHIWSMNSPEMDDAVRAQDDSLKVFIDLLNEQVGEGNWVLVLTADHGAMPSPEVSGAFQIETGPVAAAINSEFDHNGDETHVVQLIQPSQIFMNVEELTKNGYTLDDVARFIMTMTRQDTAGAGVVVDPALAGEKVFQASFPSALMSDLACLPEARA